MGVQERKPPMMDDHFDAVLGTAPSLQRFVASRRWTGAKPGYVFTTRNNQTGYYLDDATEPEQPAPKRMRTDEPESIEQILAKGDDADVQELDESSLKQLLLSFEKKITRNQASAAQARARRLFSSARSSATKPAPPPDRPCA